MTSKNIAAAAADMSGIWVQSMGFLAVSTKSGSFLMLWNVAARMAWSLKKVYEDMVKIHSQFRADECVISSGDSFTCGTIARWIFGRSTIAFPGPIVLFIEQHHNSSVAKQYYHSSSVKISSPNCFVH